MGKRKSNPFFSDRKTSRLSPGTDKRSLLRFLMAVIDLLVLGFGVLLQLPTTCILDAASHLFRNRWKVTSK